MDNFFEWLGESFEWILFILLVISFVMWLVDKAVFEKRRRAAALTALDEFDRRSATLALSQEALTQEREKIKQVHLQQPPWLEYTASFFPVILLVFVLRSFIAEPFKIPSGSMIPTLQIGDLILVNKYTYGVRLPIVNTKVIEVNQPKRGDVMVFRFPKNPAQKYIKRVVGLPGDVVVYQDKRLTINGQPVPVTSGGEYYDSDRLAYSSKFYEQLGEVKHEMLNDKDKPSYIPVEHHLPGNVCSYTSNGVSCTVPAGHYFMVGDNRDNSYDSRYWGFVPEQNIVGKAFFIWMNFGNLGRIGSFH